MHDTETRRQERVFFALWPGEAERAALAGWQRPLRELCGGKAMRDHTLHITLVFLGNVTAHRLEALSLAAREAVGEPFELRLDLARYWGHNHIVFAAPSSVPKPLEALVESLAQRLQAHCFRFEQRPYKPHATLLRHAKWADAPLPEMKRIVWPVKDFVLVRSLSDENGARYEVLERFPLGTE